MPKVVKAYPEDWGRVRPLLEEYANSDSTNYKLLFSQYWHASEKHIGYILLENDIVIGFLACVFSERQNHKFCGLSSWVVNPMYRSMSLYILLELNKLKGYTITSYTSIPDAVTILKKMGFSVLDERNVYYPQAINFTIFLNKIKECDSLKICNCLSKEDKKIFDDHIQFNAKHLVFKNKNDYCYIVFKEKNVLRQTLYDSRLIYFINRISLLFYQKGFIQKSVKIGRLHYISNVSFFNKFKKQIIQIVSKKHKLDGILVEQRFSKTPNNIFSFKSMPRISLYKSSDLSPAEIDSLYTEMFILDY